jgi:hypothetical protein
MDEHDWRRLGRANDLVRANEVAARRRRWVVGCEPVRARTSSIDWRSESAPASPIARVDEVDGHSGPRNRNDAQAL